MKKPLVTIITPIHPGRMHELENVKEQYSKQDYNKLEFLVANDHNPIGTKRNLLVQMAKGEIIVHMDSDDVYAPDWVSRSVDWLLSHRDVMITGLQSAYFRHGEDRYLWSYPASMKYVCEGTMCYWRKIHGGSKVFSDTNNGEGSKFLMGNGKILPHNYIDGFEAQITGNNTVSHTMLDKFKKIT